METAAPPEEEARIEVSVVGSPEVFGGEQPAASGTTSNGVAEEEQSIEKRDQTPIADVVILEAANETTEPKVSEQITNCGHASIHEQLRLWDWVNIGQILSPDGTQLPALIRGADLYLSVHNVQLKLLSRFPPGISREVLNKYTMVSHKISSMEACLLNVVNSSCMKFELGCQLFTPEDEIVLVRDVELFYWNIKAINLSIMIQRYEEEIKKAHDNISLMSVITAIKQSVEMEIDKCKAEVHRLESDSGICTAAENTTRNSPEPAEAAEPRENINVY